MSIGQRCYLDVPDPSCGWADRKSDRTIQVSECFEREIHRLRCEEPAIATKFSCACNTNLDARKRPGIPADVDGNGYGRGMTLPYGLDLCGTERIYDRMVDGPWLYANRRAVA